MRKREKIPEKMREYTAEHRRKRKWLTAVAGLSTAAVFATVYALILPAIALEHAQTPVCSYEVHQHQESCYDENGSLICGLADYVVHTHDDRFCYDGDGNLLCTLGELAPHQHSDDCYEERKTLICQETENAGHVHEEACYQEQPVLICQEEETPGHVHGEDCYTGVQGELICTSEDPEHVHTDECYEWTEELVCGMSEGEGGHTHTEECYGTESVLICGQEESESFHEHTEDCYETERVLTCEEQEVILHTHTEDCRDENGNLTCGLLQTEEHQHDESCMTSGVMAVNAGEIPEELLKRLADEQQIYPGTKSIDDNGNEVWTAFDASDEGASGVKVTVTLPNGVHAAEKNYLYIRRVEEGEGYYPTEEALDKAAGTRNDVQCYAIHWVKIYEDNGQWNYDVNTDSVLGDVTATVEIDYLDEDLYLKGHSAQRKLQVYNSRQSDGNVLEENATPVGVTANSDAYTGFTFETNRGGPYVFVSKYLYEGYVRSLTVDHVTDGGGAFDADDSPGNDSGDNNQIVRSYDVIKYDMTVNFGARSNTATDNAAVLQFEMTMDADITEAAFDVSQMTWMENNYTIEYLDRDGNIVLTRKTDGTYVDQNNQTKTLNGIASGSDQGKESYRTNIVSQRLRAKKTITAEANFLAGNTTLSAGIQVLGADNGAVLKPMFRTWLEGNEDNYGSESAGDGSDVQLAEKVTDNEKTPEEIRVSAAARFNLELAKNDNMSYKGWFDSSTGKEINETNKDTYTAGGKSVTGAELYDLLEQLAALSENAGRSNPEEFTDQDNTLNLNLNDYEAVFQNIRYGRITGYGITLQTYNEASAGQSVSSKGFRGISLPQGTIDFDLELLASANVSSGNVDESQYYAQLWEYNENVSAYSGKQGKNMYWANLGSTRYAAWAAPYNSGSEEAGCYNGGGWRMDSQGAHVTVSGYDFDFHSSGLQFPTHKAGNSGATDGYNTFIGSFSAGYVQVLNVCPRYQTGTLNMQTQVTVKNLTVNTVDGQNFMPDPTDGTGYAHETNTGDNVLTDDIPLYAKGGVTKANAFCTASLYDSDSADFTSKNYFLGSDFWGTGYDASGFAGQAITLAGAARIGAGDYQIRHMNLLQLFDTKALSLLEDKTPRMVSRISGHTRGDTRYLYAADPDYKDGYDTNDKTVMHYMSTIREEDLKYYESLDALKKEGYTCVGVLAELRNWSIPGEGGYSTVLKIPMAISDSEEFLTRTVGTVNAVRIWTNAADMGQGTVSWKDGVYDEATGKNSVEGYTPVNRYSDESYSAEAANGSAYDKTEYENGQFKLGSNTGGYVYGSSLLILGYKTHVNIEVTNGGESSLPSYDLDTGSYTVSYRLTEINAKTGDTNGTPQEKKTALTALTKLDTAKADDVKDQRIAVNAGSYRMEPASEKMVLIDAAGKQLEVQSVEISASSAEPTTVRYAFIDEQTGELDLSKKYEIQVYAERDTNGTQVAFQMTGVTVGVSVPDIAFDALIAPAAVENNDKILATAYIRGTDDIRAYQDTEGNMDTAEIRIIRLAGTRLVKSVDQAYIEQDGTYTYTVRYTNGGQEPVNVYLYDLLPVNGDIRESKYEGTVIPRAISASLLNEQPNPGTVIDFYYSKLPYQELYNMVRVFGDDGGNSNNAADRVEKIRSMLSGSGFAPLGSVSEATGYQFRSAFKTDTPEEIEHVTEEMAALTGIYAVVQNLGGGQSLSIELKVETDGNRAGDLYQNIANSWLGDTSASLTSNKVATEVLGRVISGVVWDDSNFNGVRDETEDLISGVTCTLFCWNAEKQTYEVCEKDVTGGKILPVTTGENGAYAFEKLAPGQYVVAFSTDKITAKKYVGATAYRVNQENDAVTNDGVALTSTQSGMDTEISGIRGIDGTAYQYAIAYTLDKNGQAGAAPLHTIKEIVGGNLTLTNSVELHANLDLGLVIASYELPKTGGPGIIWYTAGGMLLMSAGILLMYRNYKQSRKERKV